jgi:predicted transcriptional regulator
MDGPGGGGRATKDMVLRLDPALAEKLRLVAEVERRSVSDVAREAVAALVEQRRSDRRFQALLEQNIARHSEALRLLRDSSDTPRDAAPGGAA